MARVMCLIVLCIGLGGCGSGRNRDCRWPEEPSGRLNLTNDVDVSHLKQDIELAEELSVRFADASGFGPGPQRQQLRVEQCYQPLLAGISTRHGVSSAEIAQAQGRLGERGLNLIVNAPVAGFFLIVTLTAQRSIRRRFSTRDERAAVVVAMLIAAVGVAGLTTGFGRVWQMISETIRVGNGHLGGQRGLRLPWVQHSGEYFLIILVAFLVIAFVYDPRSADGQPARSRLLTDHP